MPPKDRKIRRVILQSVRYSHEVAGVMHFIESDHKELDSFRAMEMIHFMLQHRQLIAVNVGAVALPGETRFWLYPPDEAVKISWGEMVVEPGEIESVFHQLFIEWCESNKFQLL